jgi:hypothetical protein
MPSRASVDESEPPSGGRANRAQFLPGDARLARAIFVTTLVAYLLCSGREPPWGDANIQYMAAESMLERGKLDIPRAWPDDLRPDADGKFYSTYPLATSVIQMPGLVVLGAISRLSPQARGLAKPLTSHLAYALFGALTCVLFFQLSRQLRLSARASSIASAIVAFATTTAVYAHYSYSEIAQTAAFTGFVLHLLRVDEDPTAKRARWLGFYAGLLFAFKYIYAAAVLGGLAWLIWRKRSSGRALVRMAVQASMLAAPFVISSMVYNTLCWGGPFTTGYTEYFSRYWGENPMTRLWAMWLSPGKSLFLYSPPLVLGLLAVPRMWREHRTAVLAIAATVAPVLLVYSRYKLNGDYAWGYRFCVFAVPVLTLGVPTLLDGWLAAGLTRSRKLVLVIVVTAGVTVQVLGLALYWDHFIRISQDVRIAWLGKPDRSGAIIPVRSDGHCDSCFEDVHQLEWLPPFQPIVGHAWLLRELIAGADARQAEADAPWHRYTSTSFDIQSSYARARLDWWGMLWIADYPATRLPGGALLVALAIATGAGIRMWLRAHRTARDQAGPAGR